MPKGTFQAKATSNSEGIKSVPLAQSEGIKIVSQLVKILLNFSHSNFLKIFQKAFWA